MMSCADSRYLIMPPGDSWGSSKGLELTEYRDKARRGSAVHQSVAVVAGSRFVEPD